MSNIYDEIINFLKSNPCKNTCKEIADGLKEKIPSISTLEVRAAIIALHFAGKVVTYDNQEAIYLCCQCKCEICRRPPSSCYCITRDKRGNKVLQGTIHSC